MMVRSRFEHEVQEQRAARVFTDREEPLRTFLRTLSLEQSGARVISYYGVGGIGKSRLCRELIAAAQKENEEWRTCLLDFAVPAMQEPTEALLYIRRSIARECVLFDFAAIRWWTLLGRPAAELRGKLGSGSSGLGGLLDYMSGITGDLALGAGVIPSVGLLTSLAEHGKRTFRKTLSQHRRHLEVIESLPLLDLAERLPYFLGCDLQRMRVSNRLLLFFDTYDHLWLNSNGEFRPYDQATDQWVRDLLAPASNVRAFIFGRRKLDWTSAAAEDWSSDLEEHLLGALSNEDADRFLNAAGLQEPELRASVIGVAAGLPLILDLCLDICDARRRSGLAVSHADFGGTHKEVLSRTLEHLPLAAKETAMLLAVPRTFDRRLFAHLVRSFHTGFPETAFHDICGYSFITTDERSGRVKYHEIMREHILQALEPEVLADAKEAVAAYYMTLDIPALDELLHAFDEVVSVSSIADSAELNQWLLDAGRRLCLGGYWQGLDRSLTRSASSRGNGRQIGEVLAALAAVCERRLGSSNNARRSFSVLTWNLLPPTSRGFLEFERADTWRLCGDFDVALAEYQRIAGEVSYLTVDRCRAGLQAADVLTLKGRFITAAAQLEQIELEDESIHTATIRQAGHVHRFQLHVDVAWACYENGLSGARGNSLIGFEAKLLTNLLEVNAFSLLGRDMRLEEEALRANELSGVRIELGKTLAARAVAKLLADGDTAGARTDMRHASQLFRSTNYAGGMLILEWYNLLLSKGQGSVSGVLQRRARLEKRVRRHNVYHFLANYGATIADGSRDAGSYEWVSYGRTTQHLLSMKQRLEAVSRSHKRNVR